MKRNTLLSLAVAALCLTACSNEQENTTSVATAPLADITTTLHGEVSTRGTTNEVITFFYPGTRLALTYYQGNTAYTDGEAELTGTDQWSITPADIYLNTTGTKGLEATFILNADEPRPIDATRPTIYFDRLRAEANAANGKITVNSDGTASAALHFVHTRALITLASIKDTQNKDIAAGIASVYAYITDPEGTERRLLFQSLIPGNNALMAIAPEGAILTSLRITHTSEQVFTATAAAPITLRAAKNYPLDIVLKENTATLTLREIADWTTEDTSNKPAEQLYDMLIANAQDLVDFRDAVNKAPEDMRLLKVLQTADIDLKDIDNWEPIGKDEAPFAGTYNGNGYTISNLKINTDSRYAGLFAMAEGANFYNIHLRNCNIVTTNPFGRAGALASTVGGSTISQCSSTGEVNSYQYTGGLIGYAYNTHFTRSRSTCTITNAYTNSSENGHAGGLVGYSGTNCVIAACSATGTVTATGNNSYAGGLIGSTSDFPIITCCYATGKVTVTGTDSYAGGLTGYHKNGIIYNSYATGNTDLVGPGSPGIAYNSTTTPNDGLNVIFSATGTYTDAINVISGGVVINIKSTAFTPSHVWNADYTLNYNHTEE